ncbi:WD40-repeat-containing domain protein [Biscogniauxia mediterranea]|nr:WD40-repeat-containing domain protein [Biscogniauxia mediterranea]
MSSSFFTVPGKKRKRAPVAEAPKKRLANSKTKSKATSQKVPAPRKRAQQDDGDDDDDDITSGSESDDAGQEDEAPISDSDSEAEGQTAAERRLALAERYLENVREEVNEVGFDAAEIDRDLIAERLGEDVSESKGKVYKRIASELAFDRASHSLFRANTFTTTSIAICPPFAYTVHKDRVLIKWKLQDLPANQYPQTTKKKPKRIAPPRRKPIKVAILKGNQKKAKDKNYKGHVGEILCVAASENGKYVVTGGADKRLIVHDAKSLRPLRVFTHHRDAVTSLAFRRGTNQLYSASRDRTVKVWSIDNLAYVETLYGHADEVVDIDALALERCVTVGARDRTARLWKVVEETQLVFRGGAIDKKPRPGIDPRSLAHEGSMDCVAMIDEECFVTGSDNGSISLWSLQKKKPLYTVSYAHGFNPPLRPTEASAEKNPDPKCVPPPQPRMITALRTLPYSDLIFSGSWDGYIRVWRLGDQKRTIEPMGILSKPSPNADRQLNGVSAADSDNDDDDEGEANGVDGANPAPYHIKGIVNDIAIFERGDRGKDGICVIAAIGKEPKLGRWLRVNKGRNGAVVFEVPRVKASAKTQPTQQQLEQQQKNGEDEKKSSSSSSKDKKT